MQLELKFHGVTWSSPLMNEYMNEQPVSYIIGLKEPGHRKESLCGLCGPKMLSLHEPRHESKRALTPTPHTPMKT